MQRAGDHQVDGFTTLPACPKSVILLLGLLFPQVCGTTTPEFVRRTGTELISNSRPFYAIGVNSYFLQHIAAYGDTGHVREVFREAAAMGLTTVRTWAFNDARDSSNLAAIQRGPGLFSEAGLAALDFVVALAGQYGVRLILPLVNSWDDYGGMNMYVRWYADRHTVAGSEAVPVGQQYISGAGGRSYALYVAPTLTHDDFYVVPEIREWYRAYVGMLLNRVNTHTGISYKDDPSILMWELANEPRSSDATGNTVYSWLAEMSAFIKSIDRNHLVATGEEGLDTEPWPYSPIARYNSQYWLFNGTVGSSFARNITLPDVDVATVHCYPEAWGLTLHHGVLWLRDHRRLAHAAGKPVILEEVGSRFHGAQFFRSLFLDILYGNSAGMLPWQFVYDGRPNNDGYAVQCPGNTGICDVLEVFARRFQEKGRGSLTLPGSTSLLQCAPNPFGVLTSISYTLSDHSFVRCALYNTLGQRVAMLVEENQVPGEYSVLLEGRFHTSGAYFVSLETARGVEVRKIMLVR